MHVPEQLFALPFLKDVKTQQLEIVNRYNSVATLGALSLSQLVYTVPADRVMCVQSWGCTYALDGLGGGLISAWLALRFGSALEFFYLDGKTVGFNPTGALSAAFSLGNAQSLWVPPNAEIYIASSNNCVGSPTSYASISGLTFPRGSVSVG